MTDLEVRQAELERSDHMTIDDLVGQVTLIQQAMSKVMKSDEHYGVIPGTNKPTLLKPGAEKLCLLFRLDPQYEIQDVRDPETGHYDVRATCRLYHIPTGNRVASGEGYCTTRESKYAYRTAKRVCPICGTAAIIKGKAEYGGGWVCFKRQDGCGAKFQDGDAAIEGQETGKVDNPDLPDTYNTVLKMACKRALVAAVLNGTAASDIFAQDIEDLPQPDVTIVDGDTLALLQAVLVDAEAANGELWSESVVLANARQRFGRNIQRMEDLSKKEAESILSGATNWLAHHAPVEDAVFTDLDADLTPEADDDAAS